MPPGWQAIITFYLSYPEDLTPSICTTNLVEQFTKQAKQRTKVAHVCPHSDATGKAIYLVASEMNKRYKTGLLRNWDTINEKRHPLSMVKHGNRVMGNTPCLTHNT